MYVAYKRLNQNDLVHFIRHLRIKGKNCSSTINNQKTKLILGNYFEQQTEACPVLASIPMPYNTFKKSRNI